MTITYQQGDATRPVGDGTRIIAHICNDVGAWGSGFVVALSRRSPLPEMAYRIWFKNPEHYSEPFALGSVQLAGFDTHNVLVANMIAQRGVRHHPAAPPAVDYAALHRCLHRLGAQAVKRDCFSVHMPRIGCGLGGGDWGAVETLITANLVERYGIQVTVYDLEAGA